MLAATILNSLAKRSNLSDSEQSSPSLIKHSERELSNRDDGQSPESSPKIFKAPSKSSHHSPTRSPGSNSPVLEPRKEFDVLQHRLEPLKDLPKRRSSLMLNFQRQTPNPHDHSAQNGKNESDNKNHDILDKIGELPKEKLSAFAALQNARKKISLSHAFLNKAKHSSHWDPSMGPKISWTLKKEVKSVKDAEYIYETIKNFSFFSRFIDQALDEAEEMAILQICRSMHYEQIPAGQYVFKEGDASNDKFYIILSGIASVVLKSDSNVFMDEHIEDQNKVLESEQNDSNKEKKGDKEDSKQKLSENIRKVSLFARTVAKFSVISKKTKHKEDETEQTQQQEEQNRSQVSKFKEAAKKALEEDESKREDEKKTKRAAVPRKTLKTNDIRICRPIAELGVINKQLKKGESFGERALTSKDAKRLASILTNTDCEFIVLMKEDYMGIMGRYNKESKLKMDFLKNNLPHVNKISSASVLQDYVYIFNDAYFHRGNTIVKEEAKGDKIYILVSGQIKLEKRIYYNNPFETSKIHSTVLITSSAAPTMFGEEILFDPEYQKNYKYTVKVDSQEVKLYYCNVEALKMRFPKETLAALRESYLIKDKFRNQRYEFLKTADKKNNILQKTQPSCADSIIDYRARDIIDFVSKSCRGTLISKFRATPDDLLEPEKQSNAEEIEEKKKVLEKFTRNTENYRLQLLQGTQKTLDNVNRAELQVRQTSSLPPKLSSDSNPIPQRTSHGTKPPKIQLLLESSPKIKGTFPRPPDRGSVNNNNDVSEDESLGSQESELKIKERGTIEKPPVLRSFSEANSPIKSPSKLPHRRNAVFAEVLAHSLGRPSEAQALISGQTTAVTECEDKVTLPSSKRQYIIRGTKKTQTQEELEQNMQVFEQKLLRITQENLENADRLHFNDNEAMGYPSNRRTASLGLLINPTSLPESPKSRNSPTLHSPKSPFKTTTHKFLSYNPSPRTKALEPLDSSEFERKAASEHLTKRLISSLNIKKNSEVMKSLTGFSQTMTGFRQQKPRASIGLQTPSPTLQPNQINTPKNEESSIPKLDLKVTKEELSSPRVQLPGQTAEGNMPKIDVKRQLLMKLSSDREFEVPHHLKLEIMQTPDSNLLTIISMTGRNSKNPVPEPDISPDKFKSTWYGPATSTTALITRQSERIALNSQKKTKEINRKNAIRPLNLADEKLEGRKAPTTAFF